MPNNEKVTLVRHDGTLMDATPEQAGRLALLGYKEVTPEQNAERLRQEAASDYYTSPGQATLAGAEGVASGLTFGVSDYWAGLWGNDEVKERAQYNPGTRMASEVVGALLPAFFTGGESLGATLARGAEEAGALKKLASVAPTNLLSDAAHALAPEQTLTGALARGALEGAVYGGTGAANHAYLEGDPVTADAVLHGIGWGALIGGAFGAVGEAVAKGGERAQAAREAEIRAQTPVPKGALSTAAGEEYGTLRDELANLVSNTKQAVDLADASVKDVMSSLRKSGNSYDAVKNFFDSSRPAHMQDVAQNFNREVDKLQSLYDKVTKAAEGGNFKVAHEAATQYGQHAKSIADRLGVEIPDASKPLLEMASMRKMGQILSKMPKDVEGFASMSAAKLEDLTAAVKVAKDLPFTNDVAGAADNFNRALGIDASTPNYDGIRAAQKAAKITLKSEGKAPKAPAEKEKGPSLLRDLAAFAVGGKAWVAAKAVGMGRVGSYAAYRGARNAVLHGSSELVGLKAAALTRIRDAAAAWGPGLGRTISTAPGRATALEFTLMGEPDRGTKDAQELAKKRADEIYNFAPKAPDAIYKAVEPLAVAQPLLAPMLHKNALAAFTALQTMAPKDPGAVSKFQSLWRPSRLQAEQLNKQLAVFHDPVGEIEKMLKTGNLDMDKMQALQKITPPLWQEMRTALLGRLSEPGIMDKVSYNDQIFLSVALDVPLHSSMQPGNIAASQQIFLDRNQPPSANPRIGPGGGLPNPKDNNYATESQRSTER